MPPFGILNVNKLAGITSRDAVDRVERLVRPARAGHAGTLDPLATGVLVICVGQATRLIQYVQRMPKSYRATFLLGRTSDTDDVEGNVVAVEEAIEPTRELLDRTVAQFVGEIKQRPPAHSAIKVAGQRAYKLARRGEAVELPPRTVTIHRIVVRLYAYPELELDIECGSGTYVRALGRDIGEALGTGAVMAALERTAIGNFVIEDSVRLNDLTAATLSRHVKPALMAVADLARVSLTDDQLLEIRHGRPVQGSPIGGVFSQQNNITEFAAVDSGGALAAILFQKRPGELWPRVNFS
jgi:tRNA pseudouridine55 synthase